MNTFSFSHGLGWSTRFLFVISKCEKILHLFNPVVTLTLFNICAATCWCWTRPAGGQTCWLPCLCPTLLCNSRSHFLVTWGKTLHSSQNIQTFQLGLIWLLCAFLLCHEFAKIQPSAQDSYKVLINFLAGAILANGLLSLLSLSVSSSLRSSPRLFMVSLGQMNSAFCDTRAIFARNMFNVLSVLQYWWTCCSVYFRWPRITCILCPLDCCSPQCDCRCEGQRDLQHHLSHHWNLLVGSAHSECRWLQTCFWWNPWCLAHCRNHPLVHCPRMGIPQVDLLDVKLLRLHLNLTMHSARYLVYKKGSTKHTKL